MYVAISHYVSGHLLCSNRKPIHMIYDKDIGSALSTTSGMGASDAHSPGADLGMNRDAHIPHCLFSGIAK